MPDHVPMLISVLPTHAVSQVISYKKGKSAIHIARTHLGQRKNFTEQNFRASGYFVSTVGRDEQVIREYIRHQEEDEVGGLELCGRTRLTIYSGRDAAGIPGLEPFFALGREVALELG